MAFDRYDTRRGRYSDFDRDRARRDERGRGDDRGFFERAGDEIASWFGDDEAERRRHEDERMNRGRERGRDFGRDWDRDRYAYRGSRGDWGRGRIEDDESGMPSSVTYPGARSGYNPAYYGGYGHTSGGYGGYEFGEGTDRGYGSSGFGRYDPEVERREFGGGRATDRNYQAWRQRQLDELDRDYDDYCRENQNRFESDFGTWRGNRQQKRGLLGQIREHMEVVGSDGEKIGTVDHIRSDRIILAKGDSDDNRHHSIKCSMIDSVAGDQVRLDIPAEEAKSRMRDEDRGLFERSRDEDNDSVNLERSFPGTYR
jgi:hypothetical protein